MQVQLHSFLNPSQLKSEFKGLKDYVLDLSYKFTAALEAELNQLEKDVNAFVDGTAEYVNESVLSVKRELQVRVDRAIEELESIYNSVDTEVNNISEEAKASSKQSLEYVLTDLQSLREKIA